MDYKACVYTVLFGNYEELNDQPISIDSDLDFLCFTDNANIQSKTWKIIYTEPIFKNDFARSSRIPKIVPHRFLKEYDYSLYIDNSVFLKLSPETIIEKLLINNPETEISLFEHSFRDTLLNEFIQVLRLNYDHPMVIYEQLNYYRIIEPGILNQKPYCGGFIVRKHNLPSVINAMEEWLAHVLRYSRRDQLSLPFILEKHNLSLNTITQDIRNCSFAQWPHGIRHGSPKIKFSNIEEKTKQITLSLARCEKEKIILDSEIKSYNQMIDYFSNSKSWRYTKPLRDFMKFLRNYYEKIFR